MVQMRQLFCVEQNRLALLIAIVRNADGHRAAHHRIEGLVERPQSVIAGLVDDFVSAD